MIEHWECSALPLRHTRETTPLYRVRARATIRGVDATALGQVFADAEVADKYAYRPPYPEAVFDLLRHLLVGPRTVLDAGAGPGALAIRVAAFATRVDAVDPSRPMVEAGRRLPGGDEPKIRWIVARAEDAPLDPPYGLITCGSSLHWMDRDVVFPRFRTALAPGAFVAVADTDYVHGPYRDDVLAVIRSYSELKRHRRSEEIADELRSSERFMVAGEHRTDPEPFKQSVDDYIEHLHSTSTLARVRLGDRSNAFDAGIRSVFERHRISRLRYGVVGIVIWGRPTGGR